MLIKDNEFFSLKLNSITYKTAEKYTRNFLNIHKSVIKIVERILKIN